MTCGAISRQGSVCERPQRHDGCHEAAVRGDLRRWWGDVRDDPADLAAALREVGQRPPDLGGDYCECCDPDEKWCRNR